MRLRYTCLTAALLLLAATTYSQSPVHDNYWPLSGGGALQIHQSTRFGPTGQNSYRPALVGPRTASMQARLVYAAATLITARVHGQYRVSGSQEMTVHRPGPILPDGTPAPPDDRWRIYHLSEDDKPGDPAWDAWPADLGAPVNTDGTPRLYGKQQLWWVMNDLDSSAMREATGNDPLGLEVRVLVWQPRLDGALFFQYTFINKGRDTLRDAYAAHFVDADLRDALTDLTAADSARGLMYAWQRPDYDPEEGVPAAFGACFVQTPRVPSTANDSARWDGAYIRGYRNLPVSAITMPVKSSYNVDALSEPGKSVERTPERWHTLARGQALDGAVLDPHTGAPKRFWYDGDPLQQRGWLMDDGISTTGGTDYQSDAGHDPRLMTASGPFDMAPGDTQQVIIAWVFTEAATPEASIHTIRAMADTVRANESYRFNPSDGLIVCPVYTPERIAVAHPYPNPARDWIRLSVDLPEEMHIRADVYDMLGRRIRTLRDGVLPAGWHLLSWDGRDASGTQPPPGSYRIMLSIGGEQHTVPFVLLH